MKAFSIAVAVTLVLAFVCFVRSSPLPFAGEAEQEEARSNDTPAADMSAQSGTGASRVSRVRRQLSHLPLCPWFCSRVTNKGLAPCAALPCAVI
ncbi:unnamed protein product [Knipowitschia caucasica]|uniref:Hepcidin n=1 Tax=Knipowitschia caucasica TaxID=637954 RepID=A0AAV2MA55_KNICA